MKSCFADLHIHIGASSEGRPVKVTASRDLTFENIIKEALTRKGIDIVGIVDCASPGVIRDIERLKAKGELLELSQGGFLHREKVTVILGSELETVEPDGGVSHQIAYFPFFARLKEFSRLMGKYISNIELSSQRASLSAKELYSVVLAGGGVLIPAHCFTPYKSVYGNCTHSLRELLGQEYFSNLPAVELGLSADREIADRLSELSEKTFLSNSDAHSLPKLAREYNLFQLERANFQELILALLNRQERKLLANFGLDPKLGKYHRSFCHQCNKVSGSPPPVLACEYCGNQGESFVRGVFDRVVEIQDNPGGVYPSRRAPYHYQVPLEFVPGMKAKLFDHLISSFGSEMAVLHRATGEELKQAVGWQMAQDIMLAREGKLILTPGGGGHYGKVKGYQTETPQLELL